MIDTVKKYTPRSFKLFLSNLFGRCNEREYYNDIQEFAEGTTISSHIKIAEIFIKKLRPGYKVLDLGCGSGYMANRSAKLGCEVIGIDYSKKALKYAVKKNSGTAENKVKYIKRDIQLSLPFEDNFFDVVIIEEVLEHVRNSRKVLLEAYRVAKDGGRLLISVPYDSEPYGFHISPMNEKTIPVVFSGFNIKINRPFLPWCTTHIIEIEK